MIIEWGWFYLSATLDDHDRYIISWKLFTNMRIEDATDILDLALQASVCDQVHVIQRTLPLEFSDSALVSAKPGHHLKRNMSFRFLG